MSEIKTLDEAKEYVTNGISQGVTCPCCGNFSKIYKHSISQHMAKALLNLYFLSKKNNYPYYHISAFCKDSLYTGDFAKLRHWSLIEEEPNKDDPTKRCKGNWKITLHGRAFVEGSVKSSQYVHLYKSICLEFTGPLIGIKDCTDKFDYKKLMEMRG